jgi:hypothetical protein
MIDEINKSRGNARADSTLASVEDFFGSSENMTRKGDIEAILIEPTMRYSF